MNDSNLDKGDWRLQTTAFLDREWTSPWTGMTSPKCSRLTVVSVIQLTKKKQLTLPIPNATASMLNASAIAYNNAKKLRAESEIDKTLKNDVTFRTEKDAIDYVERMIEAIILAFSAVEAFANESIPVDYIYKKHSKNAIEAENVNKQEIERYSSTDEKLSQILPSVFNCKSPKGSISWDGYKQLKRVRDRIIHMKTEDRKSSGAELDTIWKAIVLSPVPHLTAKAVIDHFVKHMPKKPNWHERFLDKT